MANLRYSYAKSIRLQQDVLDYIEEAPGDGFSQKFHNIIREARDGEAERKAILAKYDKLINLRKEQLVIIQNTLEELIETLDTLDDLSQSLRIMQCSLEHDPFYYKID